MPQFLRISPKVSPEVARLVTGIVADLPLIVGDDCLYVYVSHKPNVDGVAGFIEHLCKGRAPRITLAGGAPPFVEALYGISKRAALADVAFTLLHEVGHYMQYRQGADTSDERDADRRAARYLRRLRPVLYRIHRAYRLSDGRFPVRG